MPRHDLAPSLELEQDAAAQRLEWRFERIGWVLLVVIVAAGALGLLGDGYLAQRTAGTGDGAVTLGYERIARQGTSTTLTLALPAGSAVDSLVRFAIDREYLDGVDLGAIVPVPVSAGSSEQRVEFVVRRLEVGKSVRVSIAIGPTRIGRRRLVLFTPHGPIRVEQLVLP